jgi:hypothetical protein
MSEAYQAFVLIPNGISAEKAVYTTHAILETYGGTLDEDSMLMLNETSDQEPEPEYVTAANEALATLSRWSTFGSIAYSMPEFVITVSYKGIPYEDLVQVVKISIMERAFERLTQEAKDKYLELTRTIHESLHAKRTIMDWGIEYKGFIWDEEIEKLSNNEFMGNYDILDLRNMSDSVRSPMEIT